MCNLIRRRHGSNQCIKNAADGQACGLALSRIDAGSAAAHATAALDWSLDESWELVSWPEAAATLGPELRNGDNAKRTFEAMMTMKKVDSAAIEAARRG